MLYDASSLRLEAPVLEHLALKLRPGDTLGVYIDALEREVEATIDEIVPQADAPSRSFLVKASVPSSENLFEGMFGRLRIPAGQRRHLCLATAAIHQLGQLEFVELVEGLAVAVITVVALIGLSIGWRPALVIALARVTNWPHAASHGPMLLARPRAALGRVAIK